MYYRVCAVYLMCLSADTACVCGEERVSKLQAWIVLLLLLAGSRCTTSYSSHRQSIKKHSPPASCNKLLLYRVSVNCPKARDTLLPSIKVHIRPTITLSTIPLVTYNRNQETKCRKIDLDHVPVLPVDTMTMGITTTVVLREETITTRTTMAAGNRELKR